MKFINKLLAFSIVLTLSLNTFAPAIDSKVKTTDLTSKISNMASASVKTVFKKPIHLAILSDIHFYAPELGTKGKVFDTSLENDRKLIAESSAILKSAINSLKKSNTDIVLISGDLTKNGEEIDHKYVAKYLMELKKAGKKVYVIDGNHDINNPSSIGYKENSTYPVNHVSPAEFKTIYNEFGYKDAIAKDPNSLSYVVEPEKGLRIIAIDSCRYNDNLKLKDSHVDGAISNKTLAWIKAQLALAKNQNARVLGMMHHGLINHFNLESMLAPEYLVADNAKIQQIFADNGLNIVFTGHLHVQDVVKASNTNLYDIATGSLVTYADQYRLVEITTDGKLELTSKAVDKIDYNLGGLSFNEYSKDITTRNLKTLLPKLLNIYLIRKGYSKSAAAKKVTELTAEKISPNTSFLDVVIEAILNYYKGDEMPTPNETALINVLMKSNDSLKVSFAFLLNSVINDIPPADNNLTINWNPQYTVSNTK
jgi:predicted MPP superfamily phosphohydrolase